MLFAPLFALASSGAETKARFPVEINDSGVISSRLPERTFPHTAFDRFLRIHSREVLVNRSSRFLDSLGFFHPVWDSSSKKHYRLDPGRRAIIARQELKAILGIDSLAPFNCPRPYDAGEIGDRLAQIGRRLTEMGYPFARVDVSISQGPDSSGYRYNLVYLVQTDRQCLFSGPLISGARGTRRSLLLHDMQVKRGEPFDIRKIEESSDQLGSRPYIMNVSAGTIALEPPGLHDPRDSVALKKYDFVEVPFMVQDRSGLAAQGALGLSSKPGAKTFLQGNVQLSFINLFHGGENLSALYEGDKTYQKVNVDGSQPWFMGYPMTVGGAVQVEVRDTSYGFFSLGLSDMFDLQKNWSAGFGLKTTETTADTMSGDTTIRSSWSYYGGNFTVRKNSGLLKDGQRTTELSLSVGGGIAHRERDYMRSDVEFASGIQWPTLKHQALHVRLVSEHMSTDEQTLVPAEQFRVGGYRSVRGYLEEEFAFRTVMYDQLEYLYYYSPTGSAYIFLDDGFGFSKPLGSVQWSDRTDFLGYGIGIRLPARFGTLNLEWARNKDDRKSLGRLNVMISSK